MGMRGIVSALGISPHGILAAGTFSRGIGLYDGYGREGTRGVFETRESEGDEKDKWAGTGITQLIWSTCGRYLCVVERESDGIGVWDIRGSGRRLAWLQGRCGRTNQRLEAAVMGGEVWAGGTDGNVRVWEGLGKGEGDLDPAWQFHAHDGIRSFSPLCILISQLIACVQMRFVPQLFIPRGPSSPRVPGSGIIPSLLWNHKLKATTTTIHQIQVP